MNIQEFEDVYKRIYDELPDGSTLVEVGSFTGRSASMMASMIKDGRKYIDFYCVDRWTIDPKKGYQKNIMEGKGDDVYALFKENLEKKGLFAQVKPIKKASVEAAKEFNDKSLDAVFIDAGHEYEDVIADIKAWYPKVKDGGIIAGHDYSHKFPGVVKAVNKIFINDFNNNVEIIADKIPKYQSCWWHYKKMNELKIHLFTVCWNEEILMPYFLRHYSEFCTKMTFFDNMSTDRTREIISSYPNTEIIDFDTNNQKSNRRHMELKNYCWTNNDSDYVIIVDADEFVYHPHIKEFLRALKEQDYTLLEPVWYEMFGDKIPTEDKPITEIIRRGCKMDGKSKKVMFAPGPIKEINYGAGSHQCHPRGRIKEYKGDDEFKLLHYKHLSDEYLLERDHIQRDRLSEDDLENKWGVHYLFDDIRRLNFANDLKEKCEDIFN